MAHARDKVNKAAGSRRILAHCIFTPGPPGWLENLDRGSLLSPTPSRATPSATTPTRTSRHPGAWTMKKRPIRLTKMRQGRHQKHLCSQRTLPTLRRKTISPICPLRRCKRCGQGGKRLAAAQLSLFITPAIAIAVAETAATVWLQLEKTGRGESVSDLAEIPPSSASTTSTATSAKFLRLHVVAQPRLAP